jgi:hypothetical protein
MIRASNLSQRLVNILAGRGKTADFLRHALVQDDSDGQHPRLAHWNAEKLGPEPTQEEVNAASDHPSIDTVSRSNATETQRRNRAEKLADLERRMSLGASQEEINAALIDLLKG